MAKGKRICKVCGKEYEYCKTERPGIYRWQDVACCPEHAAQYFRRIEASRANDEVAPATESVADADAVSENATVEVDDRQESKVAINEIDSDINEFDTDFFTSTETDNE